VGDRVSWENGSRGRSTAALDAGMPAARTQRVTRGSHRRGGESNVSPEMAEEREDTDAL